MNPQQLEHFIENEWQAEVLPVLIDYIAIPALSPGFDPTWEENGHIERAVRLVVDWARRKLAGVAGAAVEVVRLPGRTPVLLVDVPGATREPVLVYGHLDKQPPMEGWTRGRSAWTPELEGDRLYGRGGADDGYAPFAAVTALLALREQGLAHARCLLLVETCEESGSDDLPHYIAHLAGRIGTPAAVVALDAGCGNWSQLWLTTSLRGQVAGRLQVRVLDAGVHSGDASGVVPSPFRIARNLLDRIEDPASGEVIADFAAEVPEWRRREAGEAGTMLGEDFHRFLPFHAGARPVTGDVAALMLNRAWRPQLAVTGVSGLPPVERAAAVMTPAVALKLSLRLPPTLDPQAAAQALQRRLQADPPYGAEVRFDIDMVSPGWHAPPLPAWLRDALDDASRAGFGQPVALMGGGGGIPFLAMLGERFPDAGFVVTGVLGPESNAHGPDEFLHLPTAKRVTAAVAHVLHAAALR
ncbi:M20/M25/M40 family metallo-hydrolase [Luteimonas sp. RD2P54]|uniref:M20/M25/M40 family metallo-hydrolase n=1 Tax=Luteimonas endophytica TaxID=3042023 RepID=A0ABT6J556_9GAMM|nr:M20/M25/M40 family metallo-hydrolase [Luteimonas endophytica]MDH5821950.1 M20/M25/M40 family metallo-hydrolase [Luteimonas endophytica]